MTEETGGPMDTSGIDVEAAVADMRERIAGLGEHIDALREEADRLRERAAARTIVAVLDPPAADGSGGDLDQLAALSDSVEAMGRGVSSEGGPDAPDRGRHAAEAAGDFDPRPFVADSDASSEPIVVGKHGDTAAPGAFDSLEAAPAFESETSEPESLPAFEVKDRPDTFAAPTPSDVLSPEQPPVPSPDHPSLGDPDQDSQGATVLEFTPRSLTDPAEEPAFGALSPEPAEAPTDDPADETPPPPAENAPAFGSLADAPAPKGADDGLDAIAASESTEVPPDWDDVGSDDAAFDKFFSSDVEPEPAQRWLLNE